MVMVVVMVMVMTILTKRHPRGRERGGSNKRTVGCPGIGFPQPQPVSDHNCSVIAITILATIAIIISVIAITILATITNTIIAITTSLTKKGAGPGDRGGVGFEEHQDTVESRLVLRVMVILVLLMILVILVCDNTVLI